MWGTLYLVLMALIVGAIIIKPHLAVLGLLTMFALEQWGTIYYPALRNYGQLTNILFLSLLIFSVIRRSGTISINLDFENIKIRALGIMLIVYAAFTLLWTPPDAEGLSHWVTAWPYLVAALVLAPLVIRTPEDLESVQLGVIYFGGFLVALFAFIPEWFNRRIVLGFGEELALPLPLAQLSGYVMIAGIFHFRKNTFTAIWSLAAMICALVVMVKSGSRGQFIFGFLCAGIVASYAWGEGNSKKILPVVFVLGILGIISYFVFMQTDLLTDRWETGNLSQDLSGRFAMSIALLGQAFSNPISMLIGLGNSAAFSYVGFYPHIVPLEVLAEEGVIGFTMFVTMVVLIFRSGSQLLNSELLTPNERKVVAVNSAWWLFTFLLCFKQGSLVTSPELFMFAALHEKLYCVVRDRVAYTQYYAEDHSQQSN